MLKDVARPYRTLFYIHAGQRLPRETNTLSCVDLDACPVVTDNVAGLAGL